MFERISRTEARLAEERTGKPKSDDAEQQWMRHGAELSQSHYQAVIEASIHAFVTVDPCGIVTSWSPGATAMLGYSPDEMIGTSITRTFPPEADHDADFRKLFESVSSGAQVGTIDTVRIAKDGRRVNVVLTVAPRRDDSGAVVGLGAILTDVTAQRSVEKFLGLVVEACPNGLIVCDQGGTIVLVNRSTESLFGFDRNELVGRPVEVLVPPRLRSRHAVLRSDYSGGEGRNRTSLGRVMTACCKDGSEIEFEIGLAPFTIEGRAMFLGVILDVRDRQRIERIKNELIATVSHELRTPLTSIIGSLGLLLGGIAGVLPERAARLLTIAHSNGQRLIRLVNDMLDIEKIEAGEVSFGFRRCDIRSLVEQAIEGNQGFAEQFDVRVRLDPQSSGHALVDPDRMIQVVTNLLSNACKFSPRGSDVDVRVREENAVVRIAVRDRGPGIPDEFRSRLFDKFAQAGDTLTRQREGSGLGLHIVRRIVDRHGGRISFSEAPGGGTVFEVDLPAEPAVPALDAGTRTAPVVKAFVCSSDLTTATVLARVAVDCGFAIEMAPTAAVALQSDALDQVGVFLLELPPPDLDGVEFVRQIRAAPADISVPIIAVSAGGVQRDTDLRFEDQGVLAWLDKPVDPRRLARILERVATGDGRARLLHIEGDRAMRDLVARLLRREFDLVAAPSMETAAGILRYAKVDAALVGFGRRDGEAPLMERLRDVAGRPIPTVIHVDPGVDVPGALRCDAVVSKSPTSALELIGILRRLIDGDGKSISDEEAA